MFRRWLLISALLIAFSAGIVTAVLPNLKQQALLTQDGVQIFSQGLMVTNNEFLTHNNEAITLENLQGKNLLLFFGYTYCPDICPATLLDLNQVWKRLNEDTRQHWQVVLVSVDPERDTPEVLGPYMNYFNKDFLALTGNSAGLKQLAADLNAIYNRVDRKEGQAYLMDHSANIVVLDKRSAYRGYIAPPHNSARMVPLLEAITGAVQ